MTFFEKFFTIRSRNNKTENGYKLAIEPFSFSSSAFDFAKDQIRVVLFRECDRRGRKLLFDSNAVEKLPIGSCNNLKSSMCRKKCDQVQDGKFFDFVEVTDSHGYKYKKPSNDVTLLGEMIFGSVAMVFKGGNTCKIHSLTSPKCVVFTNIVHAPGQCHYQLSSGSYNEANSGPDSGNFPEYSNESRISSSDSKLYKRKQSSRRNISTYPCIEHKCLPTKSSCHCEVNNAISACEKGSFLQDCSNAECSEKISIDDKNNCEQISFLEGNKIYPKMNGNSKEGFPEYSELSLHCSEQIHHKYKCDSSNSSNAPDEVDEYRKDFFSSCSNLNSSLGSLRRRWMQSCFSSIEETNYEETDKLKNKTRTKLGMGLVVELSENMEEDLENFLFNHTIVIENILKKLQSSIETAYIKKENFVDLTYTAFINCQQSIYELITGGKYARAMWLTLTSKVKEESEPNLQNKIFCQYQENIKDRKVQDSLNNVKVKFLSDFCDVLVKFDTKDTNFFISTLLTAVLTHHLSWVTGVAESDVSLPQHKLHSVMKTLRPYNPIWAQLNDLNGILGSPLKSARTVVTGSENGKNNIADVIQVLTYFIRCYNVVENVYDFDFEEVANINHSKERQAQDYERSHCGIDREHASAPDATKIERNINAGESKYSGDWMQVQVPKTDIPVTERPTNENHLRANDTFQKSCCSSEGMKRSRSCLFRLEEDESFENHVTLYPNVDDLVKMENFRISEGGNDNKNENEPNGDYECANELYKKISNLVRVPSKAVLCHLEQTFCPEEDCDTVDSSVVIGPHPNDDPTECAKREEPKGEVLFVLGENEELVNLTRAAATECLNCDSRKEESSNSSVRWENVGRSETGNISLPIAEDVVFNKNQTYHIERGSVANQSSRENCAVPHNDFVKNEIVDDGESATSNLRELPMPGDPGKRCMKRRLDISSILGSVNDKYNSEQIIQGVLEDKTHWEKMLRRDLTLYAHEHVLDRNVTEALCIIGDMNSWEVSLVSSSNFSMDKRGCSGIRIGMSQLVADMLESFLHICRIKLPPDFCLNHIEKKLHEIYTKSKCVAELLNSTEVCSIEYLTSRLDISVNDVPLLLSVATTHSPQISSKYGLTYT